MDVIVSRSGGLAGLRLTWEVRVDEQPDADDWYVLIEAIPWSQPPPVPPEPDRYVYRIRCAPHEATLAERQLTGPWRRLVDRVQETTEPERGRPGGSASRRRSPAAYTCVDIRADDGRRERSGADPPTVHAHDAEGDEPLRGEIRRHHDQVVRRELVARQEPPEREHRVRDDEQRAADGDAARRGGPRSPP